MTETIAFTAPTSAKDLNDAFTLAAKLRSQGADVTLMATDDILKIETSANLATIIMDLHELNIDLAI